MKVVRTFAVKWAVVRDTFSRTYEPPREFDTVAEAIEYARELLETVDPQNPWSPPVKIQQIESQVNMELTE